MKHNYLLPMIATIAMTLGCAKGESLATDPTTTEDPTTETMDGDVTDAEETTTAGLTCPPPNSFEWSVSDGAVHYTKLEPCTEDAECEDGLSCVQFGDQMQCLELCDPAALTCADPKKVCADFTITTSRSACGFSC